MDRIKNISEFPKMEEIVYDWKTLGHDFFLCKDQNKHGDYTIQESSITVKE